VGDFLVKPKDPDPAKEPETKPEDYQAQAEAYLAKWLGKGFWANAVASVSRLFVDTLLFLVNQTAKYIDFFLIAFSHLFAAAQGRDNPEFDELAAALVGDLLGLEADPTQIHRARGDRGSNAAMAALGDLLFKKLVSEFTDPDPVGRGGFAGPDAPKGGVFGERIDPAQGSTAARRLLGFMMDFSVRAGNVALISEVASVGFIKNYKEYAEEMANNLGLGRVMRFALRPLISTLVADPMEKDLRYRFRPTNPGVSIAIKAYYRGVMSKGELYHVLGQAGYSDQWIAVLIAENRPQLSEAQLFRLLRWNDITREQYTEAITARGFDSAQQNDLFFEFSRQENDKYVDTFISEMLSLAKQGFTTAEAIQPELDTLPISENSKKMIGRLLAYYARTKQKRLTLAQMHEAVLHGLANLDEWDRYLALEGYTEQAKEILTHQLLLDLATEEDKEKAKAIAEKKKIDDAKRAAAAQKAKLQKAATLGGGQPLTLATVTGAYVDGFIPRDEFAAFLSDQGYSKRSVDVLLAEAEETKAAAEAAKAKAAAIAARAGLKKLSLAQVRDAYVHGIEDLESTTARLAEMGYSDEDSALLISDWNLARQADNLRTAREAAKAAAPAKPGVTQAQELQALELGVITLTEYSAYLDSLALSEDERLQLLAVANLKVQEREAAATKAAAIAARAPKPALTLAEETKAYLDGLVDEPALRAFLKSLHYLPDEVDLYVRVTNKQKAEEAAKEAAAQAAAIAPPVKVLSLAQQEQAFINGDVDAAAWRAYLASVGYSATDADLLTDTALRKRTAAEDAARLKAARTAPPGSRKLTVSEIDAAYLAGTINLAEVQRQYAALGFGTRDAGILVQGLLIRQNALSGTPGRP
jgi:hypothetical protein